MIGETETGIEEMIEIEIGTETETGEMKMGDWVMKFH